MRKKNTRRLCSACCLAISLIAGAGQAHAGLVSATLSFDSLGSSSGGTHMPNGYGGFDWGSQWFYMTTTAAPTQTFLATSTVGSTFISRSDHGDFFFDGADFWSRRGLDASGDFFFVLYNNGAAVYSGNLEGNAGRMRFDATHQLLTPGYTGAIDGMAFGFDNDDYDHLAMDNFRFRVEAAPTSGAVPEPATPALLLAGLGLTGWLQGRRRRTTG